MSTPIFTAEEAAHRETFLALMWALSYPGRAQTLPSREPLVAIGVALLDLETSYYTPNSALDSLLRQTTALPAPIASADYIFYPALTAADLDTLRQASIGDMLFPDRAATLILGCSFDNVGITLKLSGPGIKASTTVRVGGLPIAFWQLREQSRCYPLGWDIFLVDGDQVIGIPRSSTLERE